MNLTRRNIVKYGAVAAAAIAYPGMFVQAKPGKERPFVIDVHIHAGDVDFKDGDVMDLSPEHLAAFADEYYHPWKNTYDADGKLRPRVTEFTSDAESLIKYMDRQGVDVACIFPYDISRVARDVSELGPSTYNDSIAKYVEAYPDRFIGICGHDPLEKLWRGPYELEKMVKEHGFKGMKLYPNYHEFYANDERLFPIYEKAIELDVVLTFHTGWTPYRAAPSKYGNPIYLDDVGTRYPDLKVNMAHAGGFTWWRDAVMVAARQRNFTMDISSWCTYPPRELVTMLDMARLLVGLDRVLFGSEHTLCPPQDAVGEVQNINKFAQQFQIESFTDADINGILGLNAARVYGVDTRKRF